MGKPVDIHFIFNCRDHLLLLLCGPNPFLICSHWNLTTHNGFLWNVQHFSTCLMIHVVVENKPRAEHDSSLPTVGIEVALQGSAQRRGHNSSSSLFPNEEYMLILSSFPKENNFLGIYWISWAYAIQNQCTAYAKSGIHPESVILALTCWLLAGLEQHCEWEILLQLKAGVQDILTIIAKKNKWGKKMLLI